MWTNFKWPSGALLFAGRPGTEATSWEQFGNVMVADDRRRSWTVAWLWRSFWQQEFGSACDLVCPPKTILAQSSSSILHSTSSPKPRQQNHRNGIRRAKTSNGGTDADSIESRLGWQWNQIEAGISTFFQPVLLLWAHFCNSAEKAVNDRLEQTPDLYLLALAQFATSADTEVVCELDTLLSSHLNIFSDAVLLSGPSSTPPFSLTD